uniref:UDP-glucuronosyltransferase n=1 Tax=Polyphagotarsonemus latus TaxID=1204166 RepID=A0AAN0LP54_9ACAR
MVKIVFVPLLDYGHLQICFSLGKYLLYKNPENKVYFVCDDENVVKIKSKCLKFECLVFENKITDDQRKKKKLTDRFKLSHQEQFKGGLGKEFMIKMWMERKDVITKLIDEVKPDFVFNENLFNVPYLMNKNYKWGMIVSTNPLKIADQVNYPPMGSGETDPEKFKVYSNILKEFGQEFYDTMNNWYRENNLERKPTLSPIQGSDILNVFMYPKELNYFTPDKIPGKWFQLNCTLVDKKVEDFIVNNNWTKKISLGKNVLTKEFLEKPGKLILFSLGTLVTNSGEFLLEIINKISVLPHKFIINKGKNLQDLILPNNCIGAEFFEQLELLTTVDAFISHGGNNSFTESLYYKVPMIILPVFGDQFDNGRRLEEFKLGRKLDTVNFTTEELALAIEEVTTSSTIKENLNKISESMRKKDDLDELADLIIKICNEC